MAGADLTTSRGTRIGIVVTIVAIHVAIIFGLIRAFAPNFTGEVIERVTSAIMVTITVPTPTPTPEPASRAPQEVGAAAAAGKKAKPKEVAAPEARVPIAKDSAPKVASTGNADSSGARDAGEGTGAGGEGQGTGSGRSGSGQGGGLASKAVKIAGDINSARDFPKKSRDLRLGDHVIIALTVGTDGLVKGCRVVRPSRDPDADRITCRLASERFRFRPATDAAGNPVESVYGWKQRWFKPGED